MKTLTLSVLLCAIVALTTAAALQGVKDEGGSVAVKKGGDQHVVKTSSGCCSGWSECNGRCFIYVQHNRTWAEAENYCLSMGANLASVHSDEENVFLKKLIAGETGGDPDTWIGGSDSKQEGRWLWSDGTPFNFTFWCPKEPNNAGHEQHCLQMNFSGCKCWDDEVCYDQLPSVCAKKIGCDDS